jgi:hypothetical protein
MWEVVGDAGNLTTKTKRVKLKFYTDAGFFFIGNSLPRFKAPPPILLIARKSNHPQVKKVVFLEILGGI